MRRVGENLKSQPTKTGGGKRANLTNGGGAPHQPAGRSLGDTAGPPGSPRKLKAARLPETLPSAPCSRAKAQNAEQGRGDAESKPQHKQGRRQRTERQKRAQTNFYVEPFSAVDSLTRVVLQSALTSGIGAITLPCLRGYYNDSLERVGVSFGRRKSPKRSVCLLALLKNTET